ncbi:MAG TPA: DNA polymerase III subunit [Polyangiaceae bacterium]|nr:DNA polymerase III subunit [Polyangiaceae bacterium]
MFDQVKGQPAAVATLQAALRSGRVHHAYRFEGPRGVGKELCALAFANALIGNPPGQTTHPDLVFIGRGLYRDGGVEASELTGISVEQIRKVVLSRVGFAPHQGKALVFIVREADELTTSAANALLKTLEEPRPHVHFLLLTNNPDRLLDTVRSRTLPVRFGPLPQAVIADLLRAAGKPVELAALAEGSAHLAFLLAEDQELHNREEFIQSATGAITAAHFAAALDVASDLPKQRDALCEQLRALCQHFAVAARHVVGTNPNEAVQSAQRFACTAEALRSIERNGQPALVIESLLSQLRRT